MALIRELLPYPLSGRTTGVVSPFQSEGILYDYVVGGIPFLSAVSKDTPYQRKTAPYRKDQFDAGQDPGEQSILTWWLRSQSSFHGGAGLDFEIPYNYFQPRYETRYADSRSLDVWTPGKVTLLPTVTLRQADSGNVLVTSATDAADVDCYLQAAGTTLRKVLGSGSATSLTWGGSGSSISSLAFDGLRYYAANATGIYRDTLPTSGAGSGAKLWDTGDARVLISWVKQRLMAAVGDSIYELVGGSPPTLPTAKYTHPTTGWLWTAFAAGPSAIYMSGYLGNESTITRLTLAADGSVPALVSATEVFRTPAGEVIHSLVASLGTYLAIGTNKGVRIATMSTDGSLTVGPLTLQTTTPVKNLLAKGRFIYAACSNSIDTKSGLARIDLGGLPNDFGLYPYAYDLDTHTVGVVTGLTTLGNSGRCVIALTGLGSYLEDLTALESTGWLLTERIRYHTLDRKLFKFLQALIKIPLVGTVALSQLDEQGNETSLVTFGATSDITEAALADAVGPQRYMQFRFTLTPTGTVSPELHGYQVKALPAAKRQRQFTIPLQCYDVEHDRKDVANGHDGWATERLMALEALEEAGDTVLFQDLDRGEDRLVVIDEVDEIETSPSVSRNSNGGLVVITLRAIT